MSRYGYDGGPCVTDPWLTSQDAARALDVVPETVVGWARTGRLAGSEQVDGRWRVRRAEVERILAEREAARERRMGKWQPMMERSQVAGANGRGEAATPNVPVGQRWSAEEDDYVLETLDAPVAAVAAHLGRSARGITNRRCQLRREGRA